MAKHLCWFIVVAVLTWDPEPGMQRCATWAILSAGAIYVGDADSEVIGAIPVGNQKLEETVLTWDPEPGMQRCATWAILSAGAIYVGDADSEIIGAIPVGNHPKIKTLRGSRRCECSLYHV
jgi:hypothetical protein